MAANAYIGVNGVARKIKAINYGVNNIARKVTKGYIGVNGIARLFYTSAPPKAELIHKTTSLSIAGTRIAGTVIGSYAVFARSEIIDVFDENLTRSTITPTVELKGVSASTGNYAIFASYATVSCIDSECTVRTIDGLPKEWGGMIGLSYSERACFAGGYRRNYSSNGTFTGYEYNNYVYSYDAELTLTSSQNAGIETISPMASVSGTFAVISGGYTFYQTSEYKYSIQPTTTAIGLNHTLTRISISNLSKARYSGVGIKAGSNSIIAGGEGEGGFCDTVDAYDSSLVHFVIEPLENTNNSPVGTNVGNYAIVNGGNSAVEIYGESLAKMTYEESLSSDLRAATTLENSAFFGGGENIIAVDVFTAK